MQIRRLVLVSLVTTSDGWRLSEGATLSLGVALLLAGSGATALAVNAFGALGPTGLLGLVIFLAALALSSGLMAIFRPRAPVSALRSPASSRA